MLVSGLFLILMKASELPPTGDQLKSLHPQMYERKHISYIADQNVLDSIQGHIVIQLHVRSI